MFKEGSQQGHRPHLRFYVFMITLVLAGLFFLLYSNENQDNGTGFISALVGYTGNVTEKLTEEEETEPGLEQELNELIDESNKANNYRSIPLTLYLDRIPTVEKNASVDGVRLEFDDLSTTIMVNGDRLELKNLKEVTLSIHDFLGQVNLEPSELSLSGTAKRIEVNNIAFSSEKALPISFQGLNYQHLELLNIELKNLELPRGSGELRVGEKLRYTLEDEELKMLYFKGDLTVDKKYSNTSMLLMEGDVKGLYDNGDEVTFVLH